MKNYTQMLKHFASFFASFIRIPFLFVLSASLCLYSFSLMYTHECCAHRWRWIHSVEVYWISSWIRWKYLRSTSIIGKCIKRYFQKKKLKIKANFKLCFAEKSFFCHIRWEILFVVCFQWFEYNRRFGLRFSSHGECSIQPWFLVPYAHVICIELKRFTTQIMIRIRCRFFKNFFMFETKREILIFIYLFPWLYGESVRSMDVSLY